MQVLVDVSEVRVLLIRHVGECRGIKRARDIVPTLPQSSTLFLLLAVLPFKGVSEDEEQSKFDAVRYQKRANSQGIVGCLALLVEERARDVANASAKPDHAGHDHLLGLSSSVRCD